MTFVGTASDDVDQESGIEEFGLSEDASVAEVIAARNTAVRGVIREQLEEVVSRLASAAREEKQGREKVEAGLKASRIFTVSAREYLRLCGLAKTQASGLTTPTDTEVPALLSHMHHLCRLRYRRPLQFPESPIGRAVGGDQARDSIPTGNCQAPR